MKIFIPSRIHQLPKISRCLESGAKKILSILPMYVISKQLEDRRYRFSDQGTEDWRDIWLLKAMGSFPTGMPLSSQLLNKVYGQDFLRSARNLLHPLCLHLLFIGKSYEAKPKQGASGESQKGKGKSKLYGILFKAYRGNVGGRNHMDP